VSTLETTVNGLRLPNPFVIGSGPPGTNANVIGKALDEGWGAVICKTVSLDAGKVINVQPRYARLRSRESGEIYGWENIELISDRSFDTSIDEFKQVKDKYPDGVLIASIMEEYNRDAWHEIVGRCQDAGVDAFELNMSCPHGLPERKMGSAMGQDPEPLRGGPQSTTRELDHRGSVLEARDLLAEPGVAGTDQDLLSRRVADPVGDTDPHAIPAVV
jgi:dihydroorotate dehydrogenase